MVSSLVIEDDRGRQGANEDTVVNQSAPQQMYHQDQNQGDLLLL